MRPQRASANTVYVGANIVANIVSRTGRAGRHHDGHDGGAETQVMTSDVDDMYTRSHRTR